MKRRQVLKWLGLAGLAAGGPSRLTAASEALDALVIGAGVFGIWTAAKLRDAGLRVGILEAASPAHARASSGGESRVTRCGYGDAELYSEWAWRSLRDWQALSARAALPLFYDTGVLWIHAQDDPDVAASATTLAAAAIPFERLTARQLRARYPVMRVADDEAGFLEPAGGALMARRAVQLLARELASGGARFLQGAARPVRVADAVSGALTAVTTVRGETIRAERFVFTCGPWLDRVCPDALAGRLRVTRQDVLFFAADRTITGSLPVWADLPWYGLPDLEGRGFKLADDSRGAAIDPDLAERRVSDASIRRARRFLARRFPGLAHAPLAGARVCQYENSTTGDFVIDRHSGFDNVWIAGGGSGHGFKHGPAVGAHVADLMLDRATTIEQFALPA